MFIEKHEMEKLKTFQCMTIVNLVRIHQAIFRALTRRPLGLRATRQPLERGGKHMFAPIFFLAISLQREGEARNLAYAYLLKWWMPCQNLVSIP